MKYLFLKNAQLAKIFTQAPVTTRKPSPIGNKQKSPQWTFQTVQRHRLMTQLRRRMVSSVRSWCGERSGSKCNCSSSSSSSSSSLRLSAFWAWEADCHQPNRAGNDLRHSTFLCYVCVLFHFYRAALNAGRSSLEKGVRLSVCLSNAWIVTKQKTYVQIFMLYKSSFRLVFWEKEWLVGATPSTWNFGSTGPRWSEIADFRPILDKQLVG